ncbi:hypothetical protein CANINC_004433 [Pichia inconspicua]|uniref:Subtelomeric hrmA-associated cluster protein AFUB-079030/YDR124W-like helical bundle domain-containing protein n=1 Tax=Pichia inconspicua TaxID=52247 RepID=A0A4T0WW95_9ASCO|nr:hypothetical protein CANINC_004433 [[Candida] inconspicua]
MAATSSPKSFKEKADSLMNVSNYSLSSISTGSLSETDNYKKVMINPTNKVDVKNYLYNCFEEFQQVPCKLLAKAWIKIIEPKKQSTYPYKNGDKCKPYWWPASCVHREPDHLKKDERINLLINILRVFKHKETELSYAASFINGIGVKESSGGKDEFSERKLDLMKEMFRLVNSENSKDAKPLKLIKPGKKYSSKFYKTISDSKGNLGTTQVPLNNTPNNRENDIRFPNVLATPPVSTKHAMNESLRDTKSDASRQYIDLMTYMLNKESDDKSQHLSFGNNTYHSGNSLLSSPFMTKTSTQETNKYLNAMRTPPQKRINKLLGLNQREYDIDPNFYLGPSPSLNLTANALSNHFNKVLTPTHTQSDYHISPPPSGIFKATKVSPLSTINSNKLNKLNSNFNKGVSSKQTATIKNLHNLESSNRHEIGEETDSEDNQN